MDDCHSCCSTEKETKKTSFLSLLFRVWAARIRIRSLQFSYSRRLRRIQRKTRRINRIAGKVAKLYASGEFEDSPALDNTMLEVFDSMEQDIFIRDNITGKVLYSNKHMNDRLGMDLVDKDSFRMIPKPQDEIPVAEASDKKGRSTKFRRYINELGSIFDVTEISITWKNGEPASVMILTPAVD